MGAASYRLLGGLLAVARGSSDLGSSPAAACINATRLSRVIYVNMDHRRDRRKYMERHLAQLTVPLQRVAGPRVAAAEAEALLPPWMASRFSRERLLGTAGCLKSKLAVLRACLEERRAQPSAEHSLILLLEDDYMIRKPQALKSLLRAHLTSAISSGRMVCRPSVVRLDCWADDDAAGTSTSQLPQCNASAVVGRCRCGGTHAMLIPTWGLRPLLELYERRLNEADCVLARLRDSYCLNAGIMLRHPSYWVNDIPKGK
jgi:hypothetical protein